jgi:hypothetical protein
LPRAPLAWRTLGLAHPWRGAPLASRTLGLAHPRPRAPSASRTLGVAPSAWKASRPRTSPHPPADPRGFRRPAVHLRRPGRLRSAGNRRPYGNRGVVDAPKAGQDITAPVRGRDEIRLVPGRAPRQVEACRSRPSSTGCGAARD